MKKPRPNALASLAEKKPAKPRGKSPGGKSPGGKSPGGKSPGGKSLGGKSLAGTTKKNPGKTPPTPGPAAAAVLDRLHAVIIDRRTADPAQSHSARLLSRGPAKVAQKFGEEAVECLIEAVSNNAAALVAESADVLYHLLVMWVATGVVPSQVWAELERREGISGIAEKASRVPGTAKIP